MTAVSDVFGNSRVQRVIPYAVDHTAALDERGQILKMNKATAIALTLPSDSTAAIPIGSEIEAYQAGVGQLTFVADTGVTLLSETGNVTTSAQNALVKCKKVASNIWLLTGSGLTSTSNVVARSVTLNDITSTAAKTALWGFSVPGNKLDINKTLCIEIVGDFLNTTTARTFTVQIVYGSTVLFEDITVTQSAVVPRHPYRFSLLLTNLGVTNSQLLSGFFGWGSATSAPTAGLGDIAATPSSATGYTSPIGGTASEDSTASKTFTVNITLSASTAQESFRFLAGIAYMLGEGQKGDTGATGPTGTAGTGTGTLPTSPNSPQITNYILQATDRACVLEGNSLSGITVTIPPQSSVASSDGDIYAIKQLGVGAITVQGGAGVTIPLGALVTARRYGTIFIRRTSVADVWDAYGDYA